MKLKLFPKFALLIILVSILPLSFISITTININKESLQTAILELHTNIATSISKEITSYINTIIKEIDYIKDVLMLKDLEFEAKEIFLRTFLDSNPNIASVSILSLDGEEKIKVFNPSLEESQSLTNYKNNSFFKESLKAQKSITDVYFYKNDFTKPRINIFRKAPKFVILVSLSLEQLWEKIESIKIRKRGFPFLVNKNGYIILHKDKNKIMKNAKNIKIVELLLTSRAKGSSEYIDDNQYIVGSYEPIPEFGLGVVVSEPKEDAYLSSRIMQQQALYLIIISILVSSLIAFILARSLTKPILTITKAAEKVSNQDFDIKVNINTKDELSYLAQTFNRMTSQLKQYAEIQLDKLIAEKTKTESIIFSIDDGIVMTDSNGEILLINSRAKKILNATDNIENKKIWDYIKDPQLHSVFNELISEEKNKKEIDLSGKEYTRVYLASSQPVKTLKGDKIGKVIVLRDISLEKEIDKMKDDFLHSITHDLRNPMTSIRGFVKFLSDGVAGPLNEKQKKMIETIDNASFRLLNMINDILDIAKLEVGKMELQLTEIDLPTICKGVLELLQPQITKKSINIVQTYNGVPKIFADQNLIERVYMNLIGNAIKFTPENGQIKIEIKENKNIIESTISDTGEGIPPEYLEKIFDKYQQVTGHRKGGTGLGLTICKYIVESHKGKIWAESELGKGSKFIFWLPKNPTEKLS